MADGRSRSIRSTGTFLPSGDIFSFEDAGRLRKKWLLLLGWLDVVGEHDDDNGSHVLEGLAEGAGPFALDVMWTVLLGHVVGPADGPSLEDDGTRQLVRDSDHRLAFGGTEGGLASAEVMAGRIKALADDGTEGVVRLVVDGLQPVVEGVRDEHVGLAD
ncbi:uncharacterized protein LY79DRAFT_584812 [Colletotrichum navitas]|uniref:Uncharacterized protein n=1 Tax=Colletotrichum navitas TaxID=681940 RepID=A0AAD8UYU3_9PEZI|nr:uncharacterized protein LY79DRAFT_584812 [Colletotrichum navitas]KAK1566390.1 hypothetical protein LY79DRAFT_584812 [Colletotrichum navitas]